MCVRVVSSNDMILTARCQLDVEGRIELSSLSEEGADLWMTDAEEKSTGLCVARTLLPRQIAAVRVLMCNTSDVPITVPAGKVLANAEPVDNVIESKGQKD